MKGAIGQEVRGFKLLMDTQPTHTHTHTHTHTLRLKYSHKHTYIHAYTCKFTHTKAYTSLRKRTNVLIRDMRLIKKIEEMKRAIEDEKN